MFRDLLSHRLIQGGIVFLTVCVVGSLLYSWHVNRATELEMARHDQFLQERREKQNETHPVESVPVPNATNTAARVETPTEQAANIATETETLEIMSDSGSVEAMDTFVPDAVATAETPAEEVPVSPFGFGPYPELPDGWPVDIWPRKSADHELMIRVQIKLISQGVNAFGAIMEDGQVYPTIDNTVYIRWDNVADVRYISEIAGDPDASERLESIIAVKGKDFTEADMPSDIKTISYEDGGIDPYTFLKLP